MLPECTIDHWPQRDPFLNPEAVRTQSDAGLMMSDHTESIHPEQPVTGGQSATPSAAEERGKRLARPGGPWSSARQWALGYGTALATVALATLVTHLLPPLQATPTILFFGAVVTSSWLGGRGPAAVAIALSILAIDFIFTQPRFTVLSEIADLLRLGEFGLVATLVCYLQERNRRIAATLRQANEYLETRVQMRTQELTTLNRCLVAEIKERESVEAALEQSEKQLRWSFENVAASLKEKEILLRELHHRVKNNLQIISSFLSLQARKIKDHDAKEIFKECQARIRTIALVHDKLLRTPRVTQIDLGEYFGSLVDGLFRSHGVSSEVVARQICVQDGVSLQISHVVPCALIVNELVSNSLKYAFPDSQHGEIRVELRRGEGLVQLTVADDGIGGAAAMSESPGNGLLIVEALVRQLEGKFEIQALDETKSGTTCRVTFPEETEKDASHVADRTSEHSCG